MSTRDRYTKIIESLVNGDEASASDLLHEAFVEKAREIWNDIVEADEIVEDGVAEEEIEEAIGNEEADDFLDDIETDEDEIEAEEAFGEDDSEPEMDELEAADELGGDEEAPADIDMDGDIDGHDEEHGDIEDKLVSVEDALSDLKAEFAKIMGDEEAPAEDPEMDMEMPEPEMEEEFAYESKDEEADAEEVTEETTDESDAEELEEAAELKSVSSPSNTGGDDGKASPVAGKNDMGGKTVDMTKTSKGSDKGLSDKSAKDMGVTHPGDGAKLSPETRGHGAEKKGKAE